MKKILIFLSIILISTSSNFAHECTDKNFSKKPSLKEQRQMDVFLSEKLNLTQEQQEILKKNRSQYKKNMEKIVKEMQELHDKIKDIYLTGIPKFQADIRTAPLKAQLVTLKQNANKLRQERRQAFENILTEEQKIKFEAIKKESLKK